MKTSEFAKQFWEDHDPSKDKHAEWLLGRLKENYALANQSTSRSYLTIVVLTFVYYCLAVGVLDEVSIVSIKFKDLGLLKWVIPVLISFKFYKGICSFLQSRYMQVMVTQFLLKYLPELVNADLEMAIYDTSPFDLERLFSMRKIRGQNFSIVFGMAVGIAGIILPVLIVIVCSVLNLRQLALNPFPLLEIALSGCAWIILIRTCLLIWSGWHEFS